LSRKRLSISNDILAIVAGTNSKSIRFFDMMNGKPLNFTVEHSLEIQEIHLNQTDMAGERKVAFVDQNRDLHISPVHKKDVVLLPRNSRSN
jgi:intraflagellar transport protein 80